MSEATLILTHDTALAPHQCYGILSAGQCSGLAGIDARVRQARAAHDAAQYPDYSGFRPTNVYEADSPLR